MPILPYEPDIYPTDLFASSPVAEGPSGQWWALYTLPRREKELMRRLRQLEVAHYSPLIKRRTRSPSGRGRVSHVPLFPSYVFLLGGLEQRYQALATNCVSRCLPVVDEGGLVHDLRQIQRLIEADAPLTPESRLQPGMRVRIRSGALVGLEGCVIKRRGSSRLLVAVEFLQRGASIQLEDYEVEQISR
jgi:transcriptional antiterminator RfaH